MGALLKPIPGPAAYSDAWHALRLFDPDRTERPIVFGASRVSNIINNMLEEFLLATGRKPRPDATEYMEYGLLMEPVVLEIHKRRSGHQLRTGLPLYFSGEHPFLCCTPDAVGFAKDAPDNEWGVDAKTTSDHMFLRDATASDVNKYGQEGTDQVPEYVLWQMQAQCSVMNWPFVDVPVLVGRSYKCYRVPRDETLIDALVSAAKELAERVINDDPPPPNFTHPNTRECLRILHGLTKGALIVLSEDGYDRWLNIARRKNEIKDREEQNSEDINRILAEMGDAEKALMPKGTKAIKRIYVRESIFAESDVEQVRARIGQTKRASYERMIETKVE